MKEQATLVLDILSRERGIDVLEWKLDAFPVPPETRPLAAGLIRLLWRHFPVPAQQAALFMQFSGLHLGAGDLLRPHFQRWMPEQGTAYWSAQDPPHLLTLDEFYQLDPTKPVVVPGQPVFHISASAEIPHCVNEAAGLGSLVFMLGSLPAAQFLRACREYYEPRIKEEIFKVFPIYCPILDRAGLLGAKPEMLREWLPEVSLYVRESIEDKSIVIASFHPLVEPLLKAGVSRPAQDQRQLLVPVSLLPVETAA